MKILTTNEFSKKSVYEYRTPGSKNKSKGEGLEPVGKNEVVPSDETVANVGKTAVVVNDYDDVKGVPADENLSNGAFDIDAPSPTSKDLFNDQNVWNDNLQKVYVSMESRTPFFVQGEAGWAKTAIITQMANKCGYTVITVYLDKALPEDLGGIPVSMQNPNRPGEVVEKRTLPVWAQYMLDHPKEQFFLFFDEMNQADNQVMNALMPIVLKNAVCGRRFNNFFCGAAGNMSYENPGLEVIPRPLMARFGGKPITWITGTDEAWEDAFEYLHRGKQKDGKSWDQKLGKDFVDEFQKYCTIFASPRDIELYIFQKCYNLKEKYSKNEHNFSKISFNTIKDIVKDQTNTVEGVQQNVEKGNEYSDKIDEIVTELGEVCYNFIYDKNNKNNTRKFTDVEEDDEEEGKEVFDNDQLLTILNIISMGEYTDTEEDGTKIVIPVTKENIFEVLPGINKQQLTFIESQLKKSKKKWKYLTNEDAIKTGRWDREFFY